MLSIILIMIIILVILNKFYNKHKLEKNKKILFDKAKEKDILISKSLFLGEVKIYKLLILDDVNKKIIYISKEKKSPSEIKFYSYDYKNILKCELINKKHTETTIALGSIRHRRIYKDYVHKQGFRLILNDINNPEIEMNYIISRKGIRCCCLNQIQKWLSIFEVIIHQNSIKAIV